MPKPHDRPLRCPTCGAQSLFTLKVATISGINVIQATPMHFRFDSRSPRKFDFAVPVFVSCSQCGQAMVPPPQLIQAALNPVARRSTPV